MPEDYGLPGHVFVDCLFGSGLSRPLSDEHRRLIQGLHARHALSVGIDVPSGVDADSGQWPDTLVPAYDVTIALGAWKRAHWFGDASARCGAKRLVDIGITGQHSHEVVSHPRRLWAPPHTAHKYSRGLVAIVAGEMPGATILAAKAAAGAGAGYVKILSDEPVAGCPPTIVQDHRPLAEALADERIGCVVIGPGLGRSDEGHERLATCMASGHRLVIDADALHLLQPQMIENCDLQDAVMTPHEGEIAKLCDAFGIRSDNKRSRAVRLSEATTMAVIAKGHDTLFASAGNMIYFPQGSGWLSVAGSGDVLSGILGARLAAGSEELASACEEGVWLHHEAARQAGVAFSASDLAQHVSSAYATFL